ncbi:MAG: hypothetical protein ACI4S4_03040, partial [Candidatus Ornithospirochaeta sp.]
GRLLPEEKKISVAMILSALFSFMVSIPSNVLNLVGIVLSSSFCGVVSYSSGMNYMEDERHDLLERPLVRLRLQTTGSIMEQLFLFFTIYLLGEVGVHQNLMEAYVAGAPDPALGPLLRSAGAISSLVLAIGAAITVLFLGKNAEQKK